MKSLYNKIIRPNQNKRTLFFLVCDIIILTVSLYSAFLFRFEFEIPAYYAAMFVRALPILIIIKLASMAIFGVYNIIWRYVDINELKKIYFSTAVAEAVIMVIILIPFLDPLSSFLPLPYISGFPRSIFFIDAIISSALIFALRISKRLYLEKVVHRQAARKGAKTIIIGAGRAGEMVLRDIYQRGYADFYPVGLLDDDRNKLGGYIHGVKVIGRVSELKWAIRKYEAEAVIIAIPSLNHKVLRNIFGYANECNLKTVKIVPRIYDYQHPDMKIRKLEDISIEDLIGRDVVTVDHSEIGSFIRGKVVFISGAGGSIGSEITLQICSFSPEKVILFDIDETELHFMMLRINRLIPEIIDRCHFIAGDIRDKIRIDDIFRNLRPDIVFHAAAYKHVPMMEINPHEAVKVNIFGTYSLVSVSARYGVSKFIQISTDKAIRPTSIMGASKRIAEYICQAFNSASGKTEYLSVRFGNVLGSRGSVLPIFLDQLKYGGPITITHPDMKRYFMTIPEAVSLVIQASTIGKGGEVLVLDMGEPVSIVSLAEELIRLHGLKPGIDIDIQYTGIRPGEKMFEEILTAEEGTEATRHEKIFIVRGRDNFGMDKIEAMLHEMHNLIDKVPFDDCVAIRQLLGKYVKYYSTGQLETTITTDD
jgi:FlaA1/EpsC-like NDP-sugar epimerase